MTIGYSNGTVFEALLLARENDALRVAVQGEDDPRTFTLSSGSWISENGEPVRVEFAWERNTLASVPGEAECVWPGSASLCSTTNHALWIDLLRDVEDDGTREVFDVISEHAEAQGTGELKAATVYLSETDLERPDCITAMLRRCS